jgi:hypothetical protein
MKLLVKAALAAFIGIAAAAGCCPSSEAAAASLGEAGKKAEIEANEEARLPVPALLEPGPVILPESKSHDWQQAIHAAPLPAADRIHAMTASIPMPDSVVSTDDKGFIDPDKLSKSMHYQPLSDFSEWKHDALGKRAGILTVKKGKTGAAAFLYQVEMNNPSAQEVFHDLFDEKIIPAPAIQKLFFFNAALMRAEPMLNDLFLEGTENARQSGIPISYSFITVDFGEKIEQLHRLDGKPILYTFAVRPRFVIDGFVLPVYTRGCLWKHDNSYRFLLVASLDDEKDLFDDAVWKLIKQYQ